MISISSEAIAGPTDIIAAPMRAKANRISISTETMHARSAIEATAVAYEL